MGKSRSDMKPVALELGIEWWFKPGVDGGRGYGHLTAVNATR